jgi:hypothetical protein
MSLSPTERSQIARVAAHVMHGHHSTEETTRAGRKAFLDRFEREADPDNTLDPAERARRAGHLRKAHFARLALRSAKARRLRKGGAS